MAVARELQLKIKSIRNIKKITEAMEAVAANKMRRNQVAALQARPYAEKAMALLAHLSATPHEHEYPLLARRPLKNILLVVYTADKGLCGAFNSNAIKEMNRHRAALVAEGKTSHVYSIGKKVHSYCRGHGIQEYGFIEGIGDTMHVGSIATVAGGIIRGFESEAYDEVRILYNNFFSTVSQKLVVRQLLPFSQESLQQIIADIAPVSGKYANETHKQANTNSPFRAHVDYAFEPDEAAVLNTLLPQLVQIQLLHALLESNASEHSARMMAMKNANENAGELLTDLQLTFNKARQAGITQEISEIVTGAEALT